MWMTMLPNPLIPKNSPSGSKPFSAVQKSFPSTSLLLEIPSWITTPSPSPQMAGSRSFRRKNSVCFISFSPIQTRSLPACSSWKTSGGPASESTPATVSVHINRLRKPFPKCRRFFHCYHPRSRLQISDPEIYKLRPATFCMGQASCTQYTLISLINASSLAAVTCTFSLEMVSSESLISGFWRAKGSCTWQIFLCPIQVPW